MMDYDGEWQRVRFDRQQIDRVDKGITGLVWGVWGNDREKGAVEHNELNLT